MILGVDVSTYLEEIEKGAKYYDNGVLINPLKDLHDNGVDCMRIRLWNNPYDEKGVPYLAGTCDLDNFLKLSHLAKNQGGGDNPRLYSNRKRNYQRYFVAYWTTYRKRGRKRKLFFPLRSFVRRSKGLP